MKVILILELNMFRQFIICNIVNLMRAYERQIDILFEKSFDDRLNIETLQVRIGLSGAHEHDGLSGGVSHGNGRANFVVDRVEFGQDDAVDCANLFRIAALRRAVVDERLIELANLIDCLVAYQCLAHE